LFKIEKGAKGDIYFRARTYDILAVADEDKNNIQKSLDSLTDPETEDSTRESLLAYLDEQIANTNLRLCTSREIR
jgi:hypothetical protein